MKHIFQPNDHSCGPTCIKMILPDNSSTIDELIHLCLTDWEVGTPPDKMERAFNLLNVVYQIKEGFQSLKQSIENKKPCILRTILEEIPHWIVIWLLQ
jgi:hypothetical protein